ncbi:MAG: 4Fe-4S binding protein [Candidatus Omnitrophica bacterium]|nr:4Fe-4S binding protein [Candidatus Omnitrophota bacterium]
MKKLVIARRLSQAFFLAAFIYILWSTTCPLTGPIPPDILLKIDPLVMIMTSVSGRLILPGIEIALFMLALTLMLGRFFCGWVCPLGSAIDIAGSMGRKVRPENETTNRRMRAVKFVILSCIAVIAVAGIQAAWVFDPIAIMARLVSLNLIPAVTFVLKSVFVFFIRDVGLGAPVTDIYRSLESSLLGVKVHYFSRSFIILCFFLAVCALSFIKKRLWCRAICPLGAIYALTARYSLLTRVIGKCTHCMACKPRCRTGAILDDASYVKGECILCMDCVYDCPQHLTRFTWAKVPPDRSDRT